MLSSKRLTASFLAFLFAASLCGFRGLGAQEDPAPGDAPAEEPAPAEPPADSSGAEEAAPAAEGAAAEVAPAGAGLYWVIDFEPVALRMIAPHNGLGKGNVYWYMTYTLTNKSKEAREIYVEVSAESDNNHTYADLFLPNVERAIERKENLPLFGKVDLFEAAKKRKPSDPKYSYTTLKPGETRRCVAVFNRLDPNANHITINVAGLSNEVKQLTSEDGNLALEERIRKLYYERPGDEHAITLDSFRLTGKEWAKKQVGAAQGAGADKVVAPQAADATSK